ncbi:MAG: hypothetical protein RIN55_02070 [Tissierellaceae bacterium]|nr:hypothetical protein [Tissierellaceae bacterium]
MSNIKGLIKHLEIILNLLKKEKVALTNNDVDMVSEIMDRKSEQIKELEKYKGLDFQNFKEATDLIEEINSLQELNLLLTKQALSYQDAILESISKNLNNFSNTYSNKGTYETKNNISIIDHSV